MWNQPTIEELSQLPSIADVVKQKPGKRVVYMHFSASSTDWYAVAFDPQPLDMYCCYTAGDPAETMRWERWKWLELTNYMSKYDGNIEITRNLNWNPVRAYDHPKILYAKRSSKMEHFQRPKQE